MVVFHELVKNHDSEWVKGVASYANMYVFYLGEEIIGIGRTIIRTLEQDELFKRAERVAIPASITAVEFYRKLGYEFKNRVKELDKEGHYRLEKYKYKEG